MKRGEKTPFSPTVGPQEKVPRANPNFKARRRKNIRRGCGKHRERVAQKKGDLREKNLLGKTQPLIGKVNKKNPCEPKLGPPNGGEGFNKPFLEIPIKG